MPREAILSLERPEGAREHVSRITGKPVSRQLMCSTDAGMPKRKLTVYIPLDLYERLMNYIRQVHGGDRPHGSVSSTVAELLAYALDAHEHTTPSSRPPSHSRSWWKCQEIVARLKMSGARPGSVFSQAAIVRIIREVAGSDKRTIRKYLKLLVDFDFFETDGINWILKR